MKSDIVIYPHNREAYKKVCEAFRHTNKTCVIQPTGTGKMYIAMQLIDDNFNKKILFLTSYSQILLTFAKEMKICGVAPLSLSTALYRTLNTERCVQQYDYIIMDEFHRAGAPVWSIYIADLLKNNPKAKILGLTATPIRHLDDGRDMSDELFDGNIASYMSLAEAAGRGLVKMPRYVCAVYSFEENIKAYAKKINNAKKQEVREEALTILEKARRALDKAIGLPEVFAKSIKKKDGRYIVFCRNYEHMDSMKEECLSWFRGISPKIDIYDLRAMNSIAQNEKTINNFIHNNSENLKLLFVVDMLNEGVHIPNIDGCIMLRPTESINVFIQQLGRAISVSNKAKTIVFDVVNNISQLDAFINFREEAEKFAKEHRTDVDLDNFNIHESIWNLRKLLSRIDDLLKSKTWEEAYMLAKTYYNQKGHLCVSKDYKTEDGYGLGRWVTDQRIAKRRGTLSAERISLLEQIDIVWEPSDNLTWEETYKFAEDFYRINGHLNIPYRYETAGGYKLGKWIAIQRTLNKKSKLSAEQIDLLNKIGMTWDTSKKMTWEEAYKLAENFYKENGHLDITRKRKTSDADKLRLWIVQQRHLNKKGALSAEQVALLNKIGMIWDPSKNTAWEKAYKFAEDFYKVNGHLHIPANHKAADGQKLGIWIIKQRVLNNKGALSAEQIALLNKIGMVWDADNRLTWEESYKLAEEFFKANGHLRVNKNYKTESGYNLGEWIRRQRALNNKGKLSAKQITLLNEIGMVWDADNTLAWEEVYKLAADYYKENGHLDITRKYETADGYKLGRWIGNQRALNEKGKLSAEQIAMLNKIGMIWDADNSLTWQEAYKLAEDYYKENGHLHIIGHYKTVDGYRLGDWIGRQRALNKKSKLSTEQIDLLNKIGMIWDADNNLTWEEAYKLAEEFYNANGHLRVPIKYKAANDYGLGNWVFKQRTLNKKSKLSAEQIAMLNKIGMIWDADNSLTWQEAYKLAEEFYKVNNHLRILKNHRAGSGYNLGTWIINQRIARKKGTLSIGQVALLDKIGMIWNADDSLTWEESYVIAENFYKTNGHLHVIRDYKTEDGYGLGVWISRQRTFKKKGRLSEEQIALLNKIGMIWVADDRLSWEESYEIAEGYYKKNGHLDIALKYKTADGYGLGRWIGRQREAKQKNKLSTERIALLNTIGMIW